MPDQLPPSPQSPETAEQLAARLSVLTEPGTRGRLVARGLARGIIWRDGEMPADATKFAFDLSTDLLDHGYGLLALALHLRDLGGFPEVADTTCRVAAEAIESVARRGNPTDPERGFHTVVAAAAFHIGHYAARSFCLLPSDPNTLNTSGCERALGFLMRRSLGTYRQVAFNWLHDPNHTDVEVRRRLEQDGAFTADDALVIALTRNFFRSLSAFDYAITTGDERLYPIARDLLRDGIDGAARTGFVPQWWINTLARHLLDDLWNQSLHVRLPLLPQNDASFDRWQQLRADYIAMLASRGAAQVDLWPSQLEAANRIVDPSDDLVVSLPTSAGKTRIAELSILRCLADGKRAIYVTPLRALSAQVERVLSKSFRPLGVSVTSLYGASGVAAADVHQLQAAQIVVATPEKLDFAIRQQPAILDDVGVVVLDEGHMIGPGSREIRYEVLVQRLLRRADADQRRLVCLSAIFASDESFEDFTMWLRSDQPGTAVRSSWRPTRQRPATLRWQGNSAQLDLLVDGENPYVTGFVKKKPAQRRRRNAFPQNSNELVMAATIRLVKDGHRVLIYCPMRKSVEPLAELCLTLHRQGYLPAFLENDYAIRRAVRMGEEWLGPDHVALKALSLGIAVHHGTLPRPFLAEVERLLDQKVLAVAIASPTLAQGVDLSCSALVFQSLHRSGELIPAHEYANVVGRAGRAFVDLDGLTVYPIFDSDRANQAIRAYNDLRRRAEARTMESGIVLLVERLTSLLAERCGTAPNVLREYVLNHTGPWTARAMASAEEKKEEEQKTKSIAASLAELDCAILGTVPKLDCPTEAVANRIDEALTGSLWQRRLARQTEPVQQLLDTVVKARAAWMWNRTTAGQRSGFFAAGIGYETGAFLDRHIEELVARLTYVDACISVGEPRDALTELQAIVERLLQMEPFACEDLPDNWRSVVDEWVMGNPVGPLVQAGGEEVIPFIQDGLVYRMVWGIEAIRVHAAAVGKATDFLDEGPTGLIMTHGMPSIAGAFLLESGLSSRRMAMTILSAFPTKAATRKECRQWLADVLATMKPHDVWQDGDDLIHWMEFRDRWGWRQGEGWTKAEVRMRAKFSNPLPDRSLIRLIHDGSVGVTAVCDLHGEQIGILATPFPQANEGQIVAYVEGDEVIAQVFGPSITS